MIYIYPVGGLGNMFFHIASIWALAKDNDDELCLLNIDKKINDLYSHFKLLNAPKYKYVFNRFYTKDGGAPHSIQYPFHYVPLEYKNEHEYIGFFQSEKYFKHRRNEILELFRPADDFLDELNQYSHLFNNISLHVRRTDYVGSPIHTTQTIEYYQKALSMLPEDLSIIVFSDDLVW